MADAALIICTRRGARGRRAPADDRSSAADGRPRRRIRGEAGSEGGGGGRRVRQMTGGWLEMARGTREGEGGASAESNPEHGEKKKTKGRTNSRKKERKKEKGKKKCNAFYRKYVQRQIQTDKKTPFKIFGPAEGSKALRSHARRLPPGRLC